MPHKKLNASGFSAIEAMLGMIIVILIVFVGYYVYHAQSQSSKTLNSATQVANSSPAKGSTKTTTTSSANYLDIKELGIKFKLSSAISDAYYVKSTGGYYYFSVHSFDTNNELSGCAATSDDGSGVVALIVAKIGQPGADEANDPWTLADVQQDGLKQVGDTYYGFQKGNGPCYDVDAADATNLGNEVSDVVTAFINATPTFTKD